MTETDLNNAIMLEYSHGATRVFRRNAGMAWQGRVIEQSPHRLVLAYPHPIRLGVEGMSDLDGWSPDESGRAIYTAIECKLGKRKATDAQLAYLALVRRCGGRAGIARSVEDAGRILLQRLID